MPLLGLVAKHGETIFQSLTLQVKECVKAGKWELFQKNPTRHVKYAAYALDSKSNQFQPVLACSQEHE